MLQFLRASRPLLLTVVTLILPFGADCIPADTAPPAHQSVRTVLHPSGYPVADWVVPAYKLVAAYMINEAMADELYTGKGFYVTGVLAGLRKDNRNNYYLLVQGNNENYQLKCMIDPEELLKKPRRGERIILKGLCAGMKECVVLEGCEIMTVGNLQ